MLAHAGQDPTIATTAGRFTLALVPALFMDGVDQCCRRYLAAQVSQFVAQSTSTIRGTQGRIICQVTIFCVVLRTVKITALQWCHAISTAGYTRNLRCIFGRESTHLAETCPDPGIAEMCPGLCDARC